MLMTVSGITLNIQAQNKQSADQSSTTISLETDPSTFVLGGYAAHLRIKPAASKKLVFGIGTYALNLPDVMVNMNSDNKDKGWEVSIKQAYSLFGEYYLNQANSGLFIGLQAGVQQYRIGNSNTTGGHQNHTNLLLMPSVGYTWKPFKVPFYIKPWAGLGYTKKLDGDLHIGNQQYHISPVVPFVTLHVGYTFGG